MAEQKRYAPWRAKKEVWLPSDYDERVIYAVRALEKGLASKPQQEIVWRWLRYITEAGGNPYRPGGDGGARDTDFALGKLYVWAQFEKMLHPELTPTEVRSVEQGTRDR